MLSGQDIICLSTIDWDFIWQGHQEIMATFAAQGNRVLFIENTGVRAPRFSDLPRLRHRLKRWFQGTQGFREVRPNVVAYAPVLLPFPYSRIARWINRWLLLRALDRWMRAIGFRRPLIWTFLPTPLALDVIRALDPKLTVYYCIDNLASSSRGARRIVHSENRLLKQADLVFVTSEKLRQRALEHTPRVHLFPFGVDFPKFERARLEPDGAPEDVRAIPRPIVGYVGGLHQWVDQDLLCAVAEQLPRVQFVLIGPAQTDVSRLARLSNIHLMNARAHNRLPAYIKQFDVGIISYRLSEYTAGVYPTKLNEYLAMGIPVVATDLPEIRRFNDAHGPIVRVARDAEEFANAIRGCLGESDHAEQRIEVAKQNSWQTRIQHMSALMVDRMHIREQTATRWDTTLRRLYHAAQRRALALTLACIALYMALFQSPLPWWLATPLQATAPVTQADAIVVLAGGVGESGKAGGGYQERVKHAVDLYQQGVAPTLVFASGYTFVFQEAQVMKELAVALGAPEEAILLQTDAPNTYGSLQALVGDSRHHNWRRIVIVSSPYHMRRALLTWRRAAPDIDALPSPVPLSQFYAHERGASLEQLRGILHEYLAIASYWMKGWL